MNYLLGEDEHAYQRRFAKYIADQVEADDIEELYLEAHKKIREDSSFVKEPKATGEHNKNWRQNKLNYDQRKPDVKYKITAYLRSWTR